MTYITECATNHRLRFSPGSEFNGTMEIRDPVRDNAGAIVTDYESDSSSASSVPSIDGR